MIPVILAGGKGERFWPVSRRQRPKQFLSLDGSGNSLLQATAERLLDTSGGWENLWVVTSLALAEGTRQQLPQLPEANLLAEPEGRDTAAAVAWTAQEIARRYGEDAIVGFFPADHWIGDVAMFNHTLQAASELASQQEAIVTLGVKPTHPATGYGYIEQGEEAGVFGGLSAYKVSRFAEKPDRNKAIEFLATRRYSWNSGMFVFRAGVVLQQLRIHAPEIINPLAEKGVAAYGEIPKKSIDYAVMEKTDRAFVLPVAFGWDDLGDWNALERLHQQSGPNVELAHHMSLDTTGAIVYATDPDELIVTIGLEDVVVVRDGRVTLVVKKDRTQDIKQIVKSLADHPKFSSES
ncbi:MAG: mannose-1-phosphate guanylyltransferase [Oscillatoriaceae cyanobacterium]